MTMKNHLAPNFEDQPIIEKMFCSHSRRPNESLLHMFAIIDYPQPLLMLTIELDPHMA